MLANIVASFPLISLFLEMIGKAGCFRVSAQPNVSYRTDTLLFCAYV
jgi:hypothetical protein